jgi:hypothetical protein
MQGQMTCRGRTAALVSEITRQYTRKHIWIVYRIGQQNAHLARRKTDAHLDHRDALHRHHGRYLGRLCARCDCSYLRALLQGDLQAVEHAQTRQGHDDAGTVVAATGQGVLEHG